MSIRRISRFVIAMDAESTATRRRNLAQAFNPIGANLDVLAPILHGAVMDEVGAAMGYVVPAICLALVAAYALYDMTHARPPAIAEHALPEQ